MARTKLLRILLLGAATASPWTAPTLRAVQAIPMAPVVISATRAPKPADEIASTTRAFEREELHDIPALTLDGLLRSAPAFTLFRRSDSLIANPTAQGVSLRGLGPSGASRSLVLLDDIPLNDPFGGWVAWTKVPRENLVAVEVLPGGGATAWGNAALGGVVHARTRQSGTSATALAGDYGTRSIEFSSTHQGNPLRLDLGGRAFATDGFTLVAPERRGPIDIPAWSRHRWFAAGLQGSSPGHDVDFTLRARYYEEKRGNGTPYQRNATREKFFSLALAGQPVNGFTWNANAYGQDQSFASTFSGVNATRTAETPASDQFAVPATALGGAWTGTWKHEENARTTAGADVRFVRGETRENFTFAAGNFTRQRIAGGRQAIAGLFALHEHRLSSTVRATLGARLDGWRDTDGHRRETDRVTGAFVRNDNYADHKGTDFSPSGGLVWQPTKPWRLRANAQHAFRRATLNELYRPFRVGANVTEANPDLRTERVTSGELGAEWTLFTKLPPEPAPVVPPQTGPLPPFAAQKDIGYPRPVALPLLTLGATAFWNDLRDAIGNVTIARGPGTFPIVGTIAAGGVGRQRLNLDRTRVQGLELSAKWTPIYQLTFNADALVNDATVRRATVARTLVGNRVAQVPRRSASLGATWRAAEKFTLTPRVRYIGRQFEDDENQLTLGAVVVADLGASYKLTKGIEIFLTCENLGNARIETGRSADGIVNIGTPRLIVGGFRGRW
jgi:outer membrane receptor protein involved in Fe transport